MTDIELLESIPDSYEDFVLAVNHWLKKDEKVREKILEQLKANPDSTTSDILEVLCEYLGLGKPLEIVKDEK